MRATMYLMSDVERLAERMYERDLEMMVGWEGRGADIVRARFDHSSSFDFQPDLPLQTTCSSTSKAQEACNATEFVCNEVQQ